jgi:LysM repeat protein
MKHFTTNFGSLIRQKMTVVLATLALLGLVGSVSAFVESTPSAYAASHTSAVTKRSVHAASGCSFYIVRPGDTLSYIAATHNSSVSAIARANNIGNVNLIFPRQRFCIPASGATSSTGVTYFTNTQTTGTTRTTGNTSQSNSVAGMIYQVFGPYGAAAVRVATCESGLNPSAYNPISIGGSHAEGVFQILYPSTWAGTPQAGSSPYNAWANIQAAHTIFMRDGYSWREWTCQP